ncbi:MAG: hypothetical protein LWW86_07740 [Micrococcales bacterium]|nr:hypothetical protein [Micrococcales bacterium]
MPSDLTMVDRSGGTGATRVAGVAGCAIGLEQIAPNGQWTYLDVADNTPAATVAGPKTSFVPRALAFYRTDLGGYDYYYAISSSGQLWRIRIAPGTLGVQYVFVGSGYGDIRDISATPDGRFYTLSNGGYLRRAKIVGDKPGAYTVLRGGMSGTISLSRSDRLTYSDTAGHSYVYDTILGVTSAGQFQRHYLRVSGTDAPWAQETLFGAGWTRFDSVDSSYCDRDTLGPTSMYIGRDKTTGSLLTYRDEDGFDGSGRDISYSGSAGTARYRTYGA